MMEGAGIEHQKERQSDSAHEDAVDQFTIAHPTKLEMFMVYVTFLTEKKLFSEWPLLIMGVTYLNPAQ